MSEFDSSSSWKPATTPIPQDVYVRCTQCGWQAKDFAKLEELHHKRLDGLLPFLHILGVEVDGKEYVVVDCTRDDGGGWRGVDFGPVIGGTRRYAPNSIQKLTGRPPIVIYTDNPDHAAKRWRYKPSSPATDARPSDGRTSKSVANQLVKLPGHTGEDCLIETGRESQVLNPTPQQVIHTTHVDDLLESETASILARAVPNSDVSQLGRDASELLLEFFRLTTSSERPPNWVARSIRLSEASADAAHFRSWIHNARTMTTDTLRVLPSGESDIFDAIRIFDDCLHGDRLPQYEIERRWLSKNDIHIQRLRELSESTIECLQRSLLHLLVIEIERSLNEKHQMGDRAHWLTTLHQNEWIDSLTDRIRKATETFSQAHEAAVWPASGDAVFSEETKNRLLNRWREIAEPCSRKNWQQVWSELFEFAKTIVTLTTEGQSDVALTRLRGTLREKMSVFEILWCMRHRDAHGTSFSHLTREMQQKVHKEWVSVQRWIAGRIGRQWSWDDGQSHRESFFDEDRDLHLTAFEGSHVKLELLSAANAGLAMLRKL